jgi:predicted nucleic acid-binding protein
MTRRIAVVDTNVVAAGVITSTPASPVARVLDGMLSAGFPFAISRPLLAEYRHVLGRRSMAKLHGLDSTQIDDVLAELALHAVLLVPAAGPPAPDPGDQFLWDMLTVRDDLILVTGDKRLLRALDFAGRILTAREFVDGR